jgi:hypothetical protein
MRVAPGGRNQGAIRAAGGAGMGASSSRADPNTGKARFGNAITVSVLVERVKR